MNLRLKTETEIEIEIQIEVESIENENFGNFENLKGVGNFQVLCSFNY